MNNVRAPVTSDRGWCWPAWATSIVPGFLYMVGSFFIDNHGEKHARFSEFNSESRQVGSSCQKKATHVSVLEEKYPCKRFKAAENVFFLNTKWHYEIPKIQEEKDKRWSTAWQGPIEYVRRQSGYISKKRRVHLNFCAESMRSSRGCLVIT